MSRARFSAPEAHTFMVSAVSADASGGNGALRAAQPGLYVIGWGDNICPRPIILVLWQSAAIAKDLGCCWRTGAQEAHKFIPAMPSM